MIALLHTGEVHVERFEKIIKKHFEGLDIRHFVNSEILDRALKSGKLDEDNFQREVAEIKKAGPDLIICTCSTYGELSEETEGVERIDLPIADYIVANFSKIGVVFTAKSTQDTSNRLLLNRAKIQGKSIDLVNYDCSAFWPFFEEGEFELYEKEIAHKIQEVEDEVEVFFLAQASMQGAKSYLTHLKKEVLTSPEYGIKTIISEWLAKKN
ncbi:hypothetical protein [Flexithrix dorotheae]|uniref:hypothetical protein n=1 Tax=Flexithrix dorotheae TaxID=70993 RepID=UPI00035E37AF|nr:hypothetical protein [Flexithrix dorotheae]